MMTEMRMYYDRLVARASRLKGKSTERGKQRWP